MATGRTISASFLTDFDKKVISLCEKVSISLKDCIPEENKAAYWKDFGKISLSRDGGLGLGGGKLQNVLLQKYPLQAILINSVKKTEAKHGSRIGEPLKKMKAMMQAYK